MEAAEKKLHDVDHIYRQWLDIRKPVPTQKGFQNLTWFVTLFVIPVFVPFVIMVYTFHYMPLCLSRDFMIPTGREIFVSPVGSREILADLRTWYNDLMIGHVVVLLFLIPFIGLIFSMILETVIWVLVIYAILTLAAFYFAALEYGLLLAGFPHWIRLIGLPAWTGLTVFFIIPVLLFYASSGIFWENAAFQWAFAIPVPIIFTVTGFVARKLSPGILEKRRRGVWD
jgi:hypothetical protein